MFYETPCRYSHEQFASIRINVIFDIKLTGKPNNRYLTESYL